MRAIKSKTSNAYTIGEISQIELMGLFFELLACEEEHQYFSTILRNCLEDAFYLENTEIIVHPGILNPTTDLQKHLETKAIASFQEQNPDEIKKNYRVYRIAMARILERKDKILDSLQQENRELIAKNAESTGYFDRSDSACYSCENNPLNYKNQEGDNNA